MTLALSELGPEIGHAKARDGLLLRLKRHLHALKQGLRSTLRPRDLPTSRCTAAGSSCRKLQESHTPQGCTKSQRRLR